MLMASRSAEQGQPPRWELGMRKGHLTYCQCWQLSALMPREAQDFLRTVR